MKKIIAMFLTVAVAGALLAGCAKADEGDAGTPAAGVKKTDGKMGAPAADGKMDAGAPVADKK